MDEVTHDVAQRERPTPRLWRSPHPPTPPHAGTAHEWTCCRVAAGDLRTDEAWTRAVRNAVPPRDDPRPERVEAAVRLCYRQLSPEHDPVTAISRLAFLLVTVLVVLKFLW